MTIPDHEVEIFLNGLASSADLHFGRRLIEEYRATGLDLVDDPLAPALAEKITEALRNHQPYSAIRIGDGEANLLTYAMYPGTPVLDEMVARQIIDSQQDSFEANTTWLLVLQQLLLSSIQQADIVGVRGFWWGAAPVTSGAPARPSAFDREQWRQRLLADPRGTAGILRGNDVMLKLARTNQLDGKVIASAHFYLGLAAQIKPLLKAARQTILITSQEAAATAIRRNLKGGKVTILKVGRSNTKDARRIRRVPSFLQRVQNKLPLNLRGTLCLVGAGPWSEIYCSLIKQRGGVGVDLGSGFDLLEGRATRPIHRAMGLDAAGAHSGVSAPVRSPCGGAGRGPGGGHGGWASTPPGGAACCAACGGCAHPPRCRKGS